MRFKAQILNPGGVILVDEPLQKQYERRKVVTQLLDSDVISTPRSVPLRFTVICTGKGNELIITSNEVILLHIWAFTEHSVIKLLLLSDEALEIKFSDE